MGLFDRFKNQEEKKYLEEIILELSEFGYSESKIKEFREEGMKIIRREQEKKTNVNIIKNHILIFIGRKKHDAKRYKESLDKAIIRIEKKRQKEYFVKLYGEELIAKQRECEKEIEKLKYKIKLGYNCIEELQSIHLEYLRAFGYGEKAIDEYKAKLKTVNATNIDTAIKKIEEIVRTAIYTNDQYAGLFVKYINFLKIPANIYYENNIENLSEDLIREFLSKSDEDKEKLIETINKKMLVAYKDERLKNTIKLMITSEPNMSNEQKQYYLGQIKFIDTYENFKNRRLFSEIIEQIQIIDANKDLFEITLGETKAPNGNDESNKMLDKIEDNSDKDVIENKGDPQINSVLAKIPQNLKNREYYIWVAKFFGLKYIPKEEIDEKIYLEAVKMNGLEICNIPEDEITKEIALAAIKNIGRAICFLPSKFCNHDFYLEAAKINGRCVIHIPDQNRTKELISAGSKTCYTLIKYLPPEERTLDLYKDAIAISGTAIYDIPEEDRTLELYLKACETLAYVVNDLPENMRNPEIYKQFIERNGLVIEYIPDLTPEMYLEAVKSHGWALRYVPEKERTPQMCLEAAKQGSIADIPEGMMTKEMWMEAAKKDGRIICNMPDEELTPEFINELFKELGIIKKENNYNFKYDGQQRISVGATIGSEHGRGR